MFYLLFFAGVILYIKCMQMDKRTGKVLWLSFIPLLVALILVFSLQYDVGTDYLSYSQAAIRDELGVFKLGQFLTDHEYLFAGIVYISQLSGNPQMIFFLTALVQVIPFCFALYQLRQENISLADTMFLYFSLSLSFFNQFNGIRQYAAVNLIFLAAILLFINPKRVFPWVILFISPLFHHAAWFVVIPLAVIVVFQKFHPGWLPQKRWLYVCVAVCSLTYLIDVNGILMALVSRVKLLDGFRLYAGSSYLEKMSLPEIATKLLKLVVVGYSIHRLDTDELSKFESKMLLMSYITVCVMVLAFSSSLIWRIYLFFDLFLMFPVLFFYKYNATKKEKIFINVYLTTVLLVKILLIPQGEYLYSSILWR